MSDVTHKNAKQGGRLPASDSTSSFSSTLSNKVNAAPFVPRSGQARGQGGRNAQQPLAKSNSTSSLRETAPRFVPGSAGWNSTGNASSGSLQAAVNAAPFVPSTGLFGRQGPPPTPPPNHVAGPAPPRAPGPPRGPVPKGAAAGKGKGAPPSGPPPPMPPAPTRPASSIEPHLPDSDDLLGMTAVGPSDAPSPPPPPGPPPQGAHGQFTPRDVPPSLMGSTMSPARGTVNDRGYAPPTSKVPPPRAPTPGRGPLAPSGPPAAPPAPNWSAYNGSSVGRAPLLAGRAPMHARGRGSAAVLGRTGRSGGRTNYLYTSGLLAPGKSQLTARFLPDQLRQDLKTRANFVQAQVDPAEEQRMPAAVQQFHTLYPLEDMHTAEVQPSQVFGVCSFVFKGLHRTNGAAYALRRLDGAQVTLNNDVLARGQRAVETHAAWMQHPHIIALREVFISSDMGSVPGFFFVHDYYPAAVTIEQAHMRPAAGPSGGLVRNNATEDQMWSYLVQLASALRAVHSAAGSLRPHTLTPSKVLLTSAGRLRVGACGISEVLALDPYGSGDDVAALQRDDLMALGELMMALGCSGLSAVPSVDVLAMHFSADLTRVVAGLVAGAAGRGISTWQQLQTALTDRVVMELDSVNAYSDVLLYEISKEVENGRLMRLLLKLNCVNDRPAGAPGAPDAELDAAWSETGDRYLLKLFRDFVFHQVDDDGVPVTDWGYLIECLNKLDAGVPEKILLMSRDEQSLLVVSYADLKTALDKAYNELTTHAHTARQRLRAVHQ